ncbi:unnamed protein product [Oncorhynchus mykiss]|uniref:Reverse transcriptase domain-containing protein n=1 Tax=Oncorhynchus mykiss TaxID=8022 RepID=A0A060W0C8_ONCMY|nr:unnamed protein product [Oncorhynchus mykiss]
MPAELKCSKATGLDNIPARFLIDSAEQIGPCITYIVNLSLEHCTFPRDMKQAKVIPLYKKGIKSDPGNYRPVSILCVTSTFLERVVHEQMYEYVNKQGLMYDFQSGFRKTYSTNSCLLD